MPSAFMNYGVTGRQQDGAPLQQEEKNQKNPAREAILLRRSRIERPKEALFKKSKRSSLLFLCVAWRLGESQFLCPQTMLFLFDKGLS